MSDSDLGFSADELIRDLRDWWDEEVGGDDPFASPAPPAGTIFDVVPAIDSLGVVETLVVIETHTGFEVPPRIIRRGGYHSFEDMTNDLLPKIRELVRQRKEHAA